MSAQTNEVLCITAAMCHDVVTLGTERGHCNLRSPAFLEWDALTVFLESVMSRLKLADTPASVQQDGICLMKAVLTYNTNVRDMFSLTMQFIVQSPLVITAIQL